jgi:hypothetical protein
MSIFLVVAEINKADLGEEEFVVGVYDDESLAERQRDKLRKSGRFDYVDVESCDLNAERTVWSLL